MRRALLHLLLGFTLLLTQQTGFAHALWHTLNPDANQGEQQDQRDLNHNGDCTLCSVYSVVGHGLPSAALAFAPAQQVTPVCTFSALAHHQRLALGFSSRAPPR